MPSLESLDSSESDSSAACLLPYHGSLDKQGLPLSPGLKPLNPLQVLGEVTELQVLNIDQHPYHHHVQPYQIVALDNDSDAMNAWWRVSSSSPLVPAHLMLYWHGRPHD